MLRSAICRHGGLLRAASRLCAETRVPVRASSTQGAFQPQPPYKHGLHRSNAEELIHKVPPVYVDGTIAVCDGGGGALGHPIEFIELNKRNPEEPSVCKYCGLSYLMKPHGHGHGHHH